MPLRMLLILGALSAFGPLAIDFYLPSFPALAKAFDTDIEHVQLSLASYFVGIAFGQLMYGPLADRFGRRKPLLLGVMLFSLASIACALAQSLEQLIVARFIQALGGCAGMVISRAVVRDTCDPLTSARVYSQLMLVMGAAPILAPSLGALMLKFWGWPLVFWTLGGFAFLCWLAVYRGLPETLAEDAPAAPLSGAFGQYVRLLKNIPFVGFSISGGAAMAGLFAYISGSPFVLIELYQVAPEQYGWLFGANAAGFVISAQFNAKLVGRFGPSALLRRALLVLLFATCLLCLMAWLQAPLLGILLPLFMCNACLGLVVPNASACAMAGQGQYAGSASALLGFLQFSIAVPASVMVGLLHDGSALPMAMVMACCALLACMALWLSRKAQPLMPG